MLSKLIYLNTFLLENSSGPQEPINASCVLFILLSLCEYFASFWIIYNIGIVSGLRNWHNQNVNYRLGGPNFGLAAIFWPAGILAGFGYLIFQLIRFSCYPSYWVNSILIKTIKSVRGEKVWCSKCSKKLKGQWCPDCGSKTIPKPKYRD